MRTNGNLHGRVFREYEVASPRYEMRIDRHACPICTHRHAERLRVNERAHRDAYKFESPYTARHPVAGIPSNIAVTGVAVTMSGREGQRHRDSSC